MPSLIHTEVSSTHLQEILNPVRLMFTITWNTLVGHLRWTTLGNVWFKPLSHRQALSLVAESKLGRLREVMKAARECEGIQLSSRLLCRINTSQIFGSPCSKLLAKANPDNFVLYRSANSRVLTDLWSWCPKTLPKALLVTAKKCLLIIISLKAFV